MNENISIAAAVYENFDVAVLEFLKARTQKNLSTFCRKVKVLSPEIYKSNKVILTAMNKIVGLNGVMQEEPEKAAFIYDDMLVVVHRATVQPNIVNLTFYGDEEFVNTAARQYNKQATSTVSWYYLNRGGRYDSADIEVVSKQTIHDCYYPFVKPSIEEYYDNYLNSEESILLLMGEAGTGKTTFLRNLITSRKMSVAISYDPRVLLSDNFFVEFMVNSDNNLLVIEDADILLGSREMDGNPEMNKLLNVGDGLIKFPHKKIVFTTNITSTAKIDPALMRPGRCFDVLNFRKLTPDEVKPIAEINGLQIPSGKQAYTLAEVFAQRNNPLIKKIGF